MYFAAFVVSAFLLLASDSLAFEQGDREGSERPSSQTASQAEALFQNALLMADSQNSRSARLQLKDAMHIWVRLREPGKAAKAALQIGDRHKLARDYQEALNCYRLALDVKSLPGAVRANALYATALIFADLYSDVLAESYFDRALDQARIVKDLPTQTLALRCLADLYLRQGAMRKAQDCVRRGLRLSRIGTAETYPAFLYLKGRVSQAHGSVDEAKGAFEEALAIYVKNGNVAGQARALCALSSLCLLASTRQGRPRTSATGRDAGGNGGQTRRQPCGFRERLGIAMACLAQSRSR
jgi:tetratricopeptide (TPR) repeat protein